MDSVIQILKDTFSLLALPKMTFIDIVEIFIIAFSLYHIIFWVKKTRAWTLLKGIVVLSLIYLVAYFLDMSVIIWLFNKGLAIGLTALAVVFQPELRKALEELGRKNDHGDRKSNCRVSKSKDRCIDHFRAGYQSGRI